MGAKIKVNLILGNTKYQGQMALQSNNRAIIGNNNLNKWKKPDGLPNKKYDKMHKMWQSDINSKTTLK